MAATFMYWTQLLLQELHAHLNGSISKSTLRKIAAERGGGRNFTQLDALETDIEDGTSTSIDKYTLLHTSNINFNPYPKQFLDTNDSKGVDSLHEPSISDLCVIVVFPWLT